MKKHGNQKYARKADGSLSLRVNNADKADWQRCAALHGMSLNEWVIHTLGRATIAPFEPQPTETHRYANHPTSAAILIIYRPRTA